MEISTSSPKADVVSFLVYSTLAPTPYYSNQQTFTSVEVSGQLEGWLRILVRTLEIIGQYSQEFQIGSRDPFPAFDPQVLICFMSSLARPSRHIRKNVPLFPLLSHPRKSNLARSPPPSQNLGLGKIPRSRFP